ncbi:MAG: hypothetical protein AAF909_12555, partial [Pseudomonadota bacterium]
MAGFWKRPLKRPAGARGDRFGERRGPVSRRDEPYGPEPADLDPIELDAADRAEADDVPEQTLVLGGGVRPGGREAASSKDGAPRARTSASRWGAPARAVGQPRVDPASSLRLGILAGAVLVTAALIAWRAHVAPSPLAQADTATAALAANGVGAPEATPLLNQVAAAGALIEDPVAEARREIGASCLQVEYPENFVRWTDLNADGAQDAVIAYDVVCDGFRGVFCGTGACDGSVYVTDDDGAFRKTSLPPDAKPREAYRGLPAVTVSLSGGDCGRAQPRCQRVRVWNGRDFVAPELLTAEGRAAAAERAAAAARAVESAGASDTEARRLAAWFAAGLELDTPTGLSPYPPTVEPGWSAPVAERWSYQPLSGGRARAWIASDSGVGRLQIACRAGEPTAAIAFTADGGAFADERVEGATRAVDVVVSGRLRATLPVTYVARWDFWVALLP